MEPSIHIERWGNTGTPVVMIHGGPQGGAGGTVTWGGQSPLAEQEFQLIVPDRPGHGQSPTRGPEDMEVDAIWVAELLGDGAHLVGHSYGGCVATAAAALRPTAARSLTLVEAPLFAVAADDPGVKDFREQELRLENSDAAPVERLVAFIELVRIPVAEMADEPPSLETIEAMGNGFATMRSPTQWDCTEAVDTIVERKIPVLTITGGWSPGFEAMADSLAELAGGEHAVIDTMHHFPQLRADAFNQRVAEFWRSVDASSRSAPESSGATQ